MIIGISLEYHWNILECVRMEQAKFMHLDAFGHEGTRASKSG